MVFDTVVFGKRLWPGYGTSTRLFSAEFSTPLKGPVRPLKRVGQRVFRPNFSGRVFRHRCIADSFLGRMISSTFSGSKTLPEKHGPDRVRVAGSCKTKRCEMRPFHRPHLREYAPWRVFRLKSRSATRSTSAVPCSRASRRSPLRTRFSITSISGPTPA